MNLSDKRNLLASSGLAVLLTGSILLAWGLHAFYRQLFERFLSEDPLQISIGAVLTMLASGIGTAFSINKFGFQKFITGAVVLLAGWWASAVIAAISFSFNLMFYQGFIVIFLMIGIAQLQRIWKINEQLAAKILGFKSIGELNSHEPPEARIEGTIKLLQLIFPLSEAIVFRVEEDKPITIVGRTKGENKNPSLAKRSQNWQQTMKLAVEAVEFSEMRFESHEGGSTSVAVPLTSDELIIGVLYIDVRQIISEEDKILLQGFSEQLARNFQRRELKEENLQISRRWDWFSTVAARTRLTAVNFVNSVLTEQYYCKLAASHLKEAHAIALLDGTVAQINLKMRLLAKLSYDESLQLDILGLLDRFKTSVFNEPHMTLRRVLQSGNKFATEIHYPETGKTLDLQIALVKIASNGELSEDSEAAVPGCFLVTVNDITAQKEHERLRSETVSLMSHELRTPITSIKGFAELMLSDENLSKESTEFLEIISKESQRLSKMVSSFLTVSNLEQNDKKQVSKTPIQIDKIVREVIEDITLKAKRKRIHIVERIDRNVPLIAADKALIVNSVKNLVENAVTYSPEKTSVIVSVNLESESIRVTVEDRGYGIPSSDFEKVWEKFYRVNHEGLSKESESTGLGLPFVKEAIEKHGGSVFVESEVNQGSKFGFTLPRL